MDQKRKALNDDLPTSNGSIQGTWMLSSHSLPPPPKTSHDCSPRDMTGCPDWFGGVVKQSDAESPKRKRIRAESYDSNDGLTDAFDSDTELQSISSLYSSPSQSEDSQRIDSCPGRQAPFPNMIPSPDEFPISERTSKRQMRRKRLRNSDDGDQNYVDDQNSDDGEHENETPGVIDRSERDDIVFILSREKAKRMAQAVKVPKDTKMGEEEKRLYLELATRGCYAVLPSDWKKDFATLPESLFPTSDEEVDERNFTFAVQKGSQFYAINALLEILKVPGHVRDCRYLTVRPQDVIKKAIRRYLRWAIADAGLKRPQTTKETLVAHKIVTQRDNEKTLAVVKRMLRSLDSLAEKHQGKYKSFSSQYWPTLVGFCICGPIVTILSLDTNPDSATWREKSDCRAKYMGQFDMSEDDQDVWNSLALAIAVIHIRRTMTRLADQYPGVEEVVQQRREGDDTEDEDL